jgi:hypothetical protein
LDLLACAGKETIEIAKESGTAVGRDRGESAQFGTELFSKREDFVAGLKKLAHLTAVVIGVSSGRAICLRWLWREFGRNPMLGGALNDYV